MYILRKIIKTKGENNLPEDTKIFNIKGGYPALREYLLSKGLFENTNHQSLAFDLKVVVKKKDIDYDNLDNF